MDPEGDNLGQGRLQGPDPDGGSPTTNRVQLEHALALDVVCSSLSSSAPVYVVTDAPSLLQAMVDRHERVVVGDDGGGDVEADLVHDVVVPDSVDLVTAADGTSIPDDVQRVVVLEPTDPTTVRRAIDAVDASRHDCLVANPLSYNRIEDRAVSGWLAPWQVRRLYRERGFAVDIDGYHGPRSIARSVVGRLWQARGRPDRRDRYTHRMRARYRERRWPLALLSSLVHVAARGRSP